MNTLLFDLFGELATLLPVWITILFATMAVFSVLGSEFKQHLLAQDNDGQRLFWLGIGTIFISLMLKTGTHMVALSSFGVSLTTFGGLIWLKDPITKSLLSRGLNLVYLVLTLALFAWQAFWERELIYNAIGLRELAFPVGCAVLLGSLAAFALLSEEFKTRILPRNQNGAGLVLFGLIFLAISLMSANPVTLVAMATFSATWIVFGVLIWAPDWVTKAALQVRLAPAYAAAAIAIFADLADMFTVTFLTGLAMTAISIPMGITTMIEYLGTATKAKPTTTDVVEKPALFELLIPAVTYLIIGVVLTTIAVASLVVD